MANIATEELVKQGLAAARVGDVEDARRLLQQATRREPDNVAAWLALAGVVDSLEEKRDCFRRALHFEPDNAEAQAGLDLVDKKLAEHDGHSAEVAIGEDTLLVCYRHPETETGLRCNRCGKPICVKCANRTPVGFRCPDCIREQQNKFYTGTNLDYVIAAVIALPLSLVAAAVFTFFIGGIGFFALFIGFIAAPFVSGIIAEAVRRAVGKRRSRYLPHVVAGSLILATLPFILLLLLGGNLFGLIAPGLLLFLGTGTIMARLR
ncbi:MAG: tetratricopeptide repeat protein [Anaerolineae bacterium]